ncbi:MAG: hypothetical protein HUJ96_03495 [Marinilabiliaceae bacterium]|nr:hypothetical protein [Marinilabiliaceae bacterium]
MNIFARYLFLIALLLCLSSSSVAQVLAFPGADGGGRYVKGGRDGSVIHVTTLSDTDSKGSLRWALKQLYPRIIVFDVSGTIELTKRLVIYGDVTVEGQTAPGDGICIKNYSTVIQGDNVILRFLRFRMGDEKETEDDALWGRDQKDIIIDHCSMSWSTDECSSFYNNTNFTMQWCILGESLRNSVHDKGKHGYGGIWGGQYATFHHNFLIHHDSRNPRMCGPRFRTIADGSEEANNTANAEELVDMTNCVFYNWGDNSGYAGEGGRYNFVNNYYKAGPAAKSSAKYRIFQPYALNDASTNLRNGTTGLYYVNGNFMVDKGANWDYSGFTPNKNSQSTFYKTLQDGTTAETTVMDATTLRTTTMFNFGNMHPASVDDAATAYDKVLMYAGCSLNRDAVDARYAREADERKTTYIGSNGSSNGLIDSQTDVGGYPYYASTTKPVDSDDDGMPDAWETANGLNPNEASDATLNTIDSNYNNIEVYCNSLVADVMNCTATINTDETKGYGEIPTTPSTIWDFSDFSAATIDNLQNDNSWTLVASKTGRFASPAFSGTLKANGIAIEETKELIFGTFAADKLRINTDSSPNNIQLNGGNLTITISNVLAGSSIEVDYKSANSTEERGWNASNATPATQKTITRTTHTFTASETGNVVLTTTAGVNLYSITLKCSTTPLPAIETNATEVSREYYSVDGRKHSHKQKGLNIIRITYDNGHVKFIKTI